MTKPLIAVVTAGQGAQKPRLLTPWLKVPGVTEKLAASVSYTHLTLPTKA